MATPTDPYVPLESGDRLTREEFHRRYCARPDIRKAELVQGVVYVASPTRHIFHSRQHSLVMWWLNGYAMMVPDVDVADNATVYLDPDSEPQPDACLFRIGRNARSRLTVDGYIEGAPELTVEIAASSASYDLHDKLEAYRKAGVEEYIVWQVFEKRINWLRLRNGVYIPLQPNADGMIESEVFPGLRLPVAAMLAGDRAAVLAAVTPSPDA